MKDEPQFSHLSPDGAARMVDLAGKPVTHRSARAEAWVNVGSKIAARLQQDDGLAKGNVFETSRIAGIMAPERTPELIPMCHPLALDVVEVESQVVDDRVRIVSRVTCEGKTGVEMEAMTAASVAALTVYDMVKSAGKEVQIGPVRLLEKHGGKIGPLETEGKSSCRRLRPCVSAKTRVSENTRLILLCFDPIMASRVTLTPARGTGR